MATLIPSLHASARRMTSGERRFAQRLIEKLEDDYLCWYDVPVGRRTRYPDFIILHPARGLLIMEVKDWKLANIREADPKRVVLQTDSGLKTHLNPLEQARQCVHQVVDELERDPLLREEAERFRGRLCCPYGYGVVLTNISREAFEKSGLAEAIDPGRVICQDEMYESVEAEEFQQRLWGMFTVAFRSMLTLAQIDRIRWHLFPQIRVRASQLPLIEGDPETTEERPPDPDLMKVMDLQQEQLARSLGEGHRVIHGVAGSGKTLILVYRAERLAETLVKPTLVLCYNKALAAKLADVFESKRISAHVHVKTFHSFCAEQLRVFGVERPSEQGDDYFNALVATVIQGVEEGRIPRAQYGALLIDEGHDFQPEWLKLAAQMVDPVTNALLLLYDDAQSIYEPGKKRKFTFSSVGIQAQGRTSILRVNYRNPREVLMLAYDLAKDFITPAEADEDGVPLVRPTSAGRSGSPPVLRRFANLQQELEYLGRQFLALNSSGHPWHDMAVLCRAKWMAEKVAAHLATRRIPVEMVGSRRAPVFHPREDSVKVLTIHSSKGLEFPIVAVPGLGYLPADAEHQRDEAKLLYVAMTRTTDKLLMTYHQETPLLARLRFGSPSMGVTADA